LVRTVSFGDDVVQRGEVSVFIDRNRVVLGGAEFVLVLVAMRIEFHLQAAAYAGW
jgi:hypothetical protein